MQNFSTMTDFVNHTKTGTAPLEAKAKQPDTSNLANYQTAAPSVGQNVMQVQQESKPSAPVEAVPSEVKEATQDVQIKTSPSSDTVELNKQLRKAKRKNGLIEKAYDKAKNLTGIGVGSKKIQEAINSGKDAKEIEEQISDYRVSQERSSQTVGDVLSILAAGGTFFASRNRLIEHNANRALKNKDGFGALVSDAIFGRAKNIKAGQIGKMTIGLAISAAFVGGLVKYAVMKANRIGSERYQIDKEDQLSKNDLRKERQYLKAEKRSASFKNFATGAINGLMMPVMSLGGIIGTPIYLAGNMVSRYFIGENNDEESKTPATFVKSIAKNPITTAAAAALIAVPLFKKGQFSTALAKNYDKVVSNLNNAKLTKLGTGKTAYQQLEEILLDSRRISDIIYSGADDNQKILDLTKENIFAIKFLQIQDASSGLSKVLKEACPPSRTMEEAQKMVSKTFGKKYKLEKCLGVGTVAETYLAKDSNGGEVCIKMLKRGIKPEKIEADRKKFLDIIKAHYAGHPEKKDEMNYIIKNMENISDSIKKEIDFGNEMEAAKRLAQHTTKAKVVQPIEVKNGLYVMEKADGISLDSFLSLNSLYSEKKIAEAMGHDVTDIERQIAAIKAKTPAFNDINFDKEDADYILQQYMDVLVEQFSKTEKGGKTIHGDIHAGNIFINPDALRKREGNVFTLIDTGNTIEQTAEKAARVINLQTYIDNADVENLAAYALDGAKLPKGTSKEKASELMQKELKDIFFNNKTAIGRMNADEFAKISDTIMQKLGYIPSDSQGALLKAQKSAESSLEGLRRTMFDRILSGLFGGDGNILSDGASWGVLEAKYNFNKAAQEKANLKKLSPIERAKIKRSKSAPKKNSIEYLTYQLKQLVKPYEEPKARTPMMGLFG